MSVRKVHSNGRTVVGYINSKKSEQEVQFESLLEKEFLFILQFDSNVISIQDQPVRIPFTLRGEERTYVPDFLVKYKDGKTVLFEVKYEMDLQTNSRKYAARFKAGKIFASSQGFLFRVITDKQIRTQYKENLKYLLLFRNSSAELEHQHTILNLLREYKQLSFLQLIDLIGDCSETQRALIRPFWTLLWNQVITADMFAPLTMQSKVWVVGEHHPAVQLSFPYHKVPKIKSPKV